MTSQRIEIQIMLSGIQPEFTKNVLKVWSKILVVKLDEG
jgi:hypothetical protein